MMLRLACALLLASVACGGGQRTDEPAPSNQAPAAGEESPEPSAPQAPDQSVPPAQPSGPERSGAIDRDADGVLDDMDRCPDEPEDRDGFEDEDGCPEPDNDRDGILDVDDKCPAQPESKNGRQDEDGCPD